MTAPLCASGEFDKDMWFDPERFEQAQAVCRQCPLMQECAEVGKPYEYGVWGGTLPAQRSYKHEEDGKWLL